MTGTKELKFVSLIGRDAMPVCVTSTYFDHNFAFGEIKAVFFKGLDIIECLEDSTVEIIEQKAAEKLELLKEKRGQS